MEEEIPSSVAAHGLAGVPDGYERLWTPHRMVYVDGPAKVTDTDAQGCPFCVGPHHDDETALIVARGQHCFVVLNLYPYNPGHLLICPYRHVPDLTEMSREERSESTEMIEHAMEVLRETKSPTGFNIGMNAGRAAGAGITAHAHWHVVPRWDGDANFLPIIGQTKAIPELLSQTRTQLAQHWSQYGTG